MITAIDTNILLDILVDDPQFSEKSGQLIEKQNQFGALIISPIVYSELLIFFLKKHETLAISRLEEFLNELDIQISYFSKEDFILSAQAYQNFSDIKQIICPRCGAVNQFICKKCNSRIFWRNHLITDFLIGAHAQNHADVLLTRDSAYYNKYFKLRLLP